MKMSTRIKFMYGLSCCLALVFISLAWTKTLLSRIPCGIYPEYSRAPLIADLSISNENSRTLPKVNRRQVTAVSTIIRTGHTSETDTHVRFPTLVNGKDINADIDNYFTMAQNETKDPFVNLHQYKYTLNSEVCVGRDLFLVILIHSAPRNIRKRNYMRTTIGTVKTYKGKEIAVVFFIGLVPNETDQKAINIESTRYKDIVQGNFRDAYKNLTRKHIMVMHWFMENCVAEYILKLDDDTFVNPYRTVDYLSEQPPRGMTMHCYVLSKEEPIRDTSSKWHTPKSQYPFSVFPPFCLGFAYFTTTQSLSAMFRVSSNTRKMDMDDVYVSAVLALRAGVNRIEFRSRAYTCPGTKGKIDVRKLNTMIIFIDRHEHCGVGPFEKWSEIHNMNTLSGDN